MGCVFNRGTRDAPRWYARYRDVDGKWKSVPSGQPTAAMAKRYLLQIESRIAAGKVGIERTDDLPRCAELMERWAASLTNRNAADDRGRLAKHVLPVFGSMLLRDVTLAVIMDWIDRQRAAATLADASIRHNLNLLSRFFGWAIERGHATINPVRQIPTGRRPHQSQKLDIPWLDDDALVRLIIGDLPEPVGLMFYLGNRSGLRTGEIAGLRMADLVYLDEGAIRVRFSYDGHLKEDKARTGKMKWVPAADDAGAVLGPWLDRRQAQGAGPEDLVFPCLTRGGRCYRKEYIEGCWERVAAARRLTMTWYQATRHSFVSRNLSRGAALDEVSAAVGHSSPVVTRRYYDHFVRRSFSTELRGGLGLGKESQATPSIILLRKRSS